MRDQEFIFPENVQALARHDDPETSHIAAAMVDIPKGMKETFLLMLPFGDDGCIADDIEKATGRRSNVITPRFARMEECGMIEKVYILKSNGEKSDELLKRKGHIGGGLQLVRRVIIPEPGVKFVKSPKKRKIIPSLPEDEPGLRTKYFQTQRGLDGFVKTLAAWKLKPGLNIRITIEVLE